MAEQVLLKNFKALLKEFFHVPGSVSVCVIFSSCIREAEEGSLSKELVLRQPEWFNRETLS